MRVNIYIQEEWFLVANIVSLEEQHLCFTDQLGDVSLEVLDRVYSPVQVGELCWNEPVHLHRELQSRQGQDNEQDGVSV